jgi:hypothetical protein
MPNFAARLSFSAVVLLGLSIGVASQTPPRPLRASEVLALEAGGVLPANVAHEIDVRGLNFHPDEDYRALLNTSGADATVLAALNEKRAAKLGIWTSNATTSNLTIQSLRPPRFLLSPSLGLGNLERHSTFRSPISSDALALTVFWIIDIRFLRLDKII